MQGWAIACLLYGISEVGVSKDVGHLAIFQNKDQPEMIVGLAKLLFWYLHDSTTQFGKNRFVFVHRFEFHRKRLGVKVCAIDLYGNFRITIPSPLSKKSSRL